MRLDKSRNHRGARRVQHASGQQQQGERRITDEGLLEERGHDRADGQRRSQMLADNEQALS